MKLKKGALALITARLRSTAQDGVTPEMEKALRAIVGDEEMDKLIGADGDLDLITAEDEDPEKKEPEKAPVAKDSETPAPVPRDTAMDADAIAAAVGAKIESKYAARDAVESIVGRIACDSFPDAAAIYAYALKQKGIACDGINEAGLKALVAMQRDVKPVRETAQDAAPSTLTTRFKQG